MRDALYPATLAVLSPHEKMRVPFKSRVAVCSLFELEHVITVDGSEAEHLCEIGYANRIISPGSAFVGRIELSMTTEEFREHTGRRAKLPGRPKPTLNAQSSTGDAGRGNNLKPRYRVLHLRPTGAQHETHPVAHVHGAAVRLGANG